MKPPSANLPPKSTQSRPLARMTTTPLPHSSQKIYITKEKPGTDEGREGVEEGEEPALGPLKPLTQTKRNANNYMHNSWKRQHQSAGRKAPLVKRSVSPPSPKAKTSNR